MAIHLRRREFIFTLGGAAAAWPLAARAQALPLIGLLESRSSDGMANRLAGFRQGLKEVGFVDAENVRVIYRWADNRADRLPEMAADLVRQQPDVIFASGGPLPALAAKAATTTIPIVFLVGQDPTKLGLVSSLARPGGNLTGLNLFANELEAKRLQLLHQLVPRAVRFAVLTNPADTMYTEITLQEVGTAARALGLQLKIFGATTAHEIDEAFSAMGQELPDALFVGAHPFLNARRVQLVRLAAFHRLPATYTLRDSAEAGGLMAYGPSIVDAFRQCGVYAGHVLKGAKPADLPVLQASKFELVINAGTARMLGISVPPTLLATADEVIE
jgi:putative ABC transport system substrate-binding protein